MSGLFNNTGETKWQLSDLGQKTALATSPECLTTILLPIQLVTMSEKQKPLYTKYLNKN